MKADDGVAEEDGGFRAKARRHAVSLVLCMVSLPLLILFASRADSRPSFGWILQPVESDAKLDSGDPPRDKLLGGLLSTAFENETSCRSRYEVASYWKPTGHLPSAYLVQKLRAYEALHKRCGPKSKLFRWSINQLKSNKRTGYSECNYIVWIHTDGLGNRIISIVSAFLYALLNDKVLLLDMKGDLRGLFCEPFPESSWALPPKSFPVKDYTYYDEKKPDSFGNLIKNKVVNFDDTGPAENASVPIFAFLQLKHDNGELDKRFFCDESQRLLRRVPWLLLRSNQYFTPGFFLLPQYAEELDRLFPEKDTVFHHLARYLFHPSDTVWGYITRYHEAYLSNGYKQMVGIQTRIIGNTYENQLVQMVNCSMDEKLLPQIDVKRPISSTTSHGAYRTVVLVTSLKIGYFEKLRDMFYEHPTIDGQVISVNQPSHEEVQRMGNQSHNMKALSEMYLLSFSDVLITSGLSTFGYVAQGLGGLRPWIMHHPVCSRAMSMEPCYHYPGTHSCKGRKYDDKGAVVPHVRHCEDRNGGIKLFGQAS